MHHPLEAAKAAAEDAAWAETDKGSISGTMGYTLLTWHILSAGNLKKAARAADAAAKAKRIGSAVCRTPATARGGSS